MRFGGEKFISENAIILEDLAVHPDYQGQGFGTLLLAALKEVTRQQDRPGIYLLCEDELLAYFEMNGFVEQGIVDGERSSEVAFLMRWQNPYYQEEIWLLDQARLTDLDRIFEIELENFSIEEAIPRPVFEAHLKEIKTSFLVAEKEGKILGYIEGPVVPHRYLQDLSLQKKSKTTVIEKGAIFL